MKYLLSIFALLGTISSFGQEKEHYYLFLDAETKVPVDNVSVSERNGYKYGMSDANGLIKFVSQGEIDSFEAYQISYKRVRFACGERKIYLIRDTIPLGMLYYYQYQKPSDLVCRNSKNSSPPEFSDLLEDFPKYSGGRLCFDNYVYESMRGFSGSVDFKGFKKLIVVFTISDTGYITSVQVEPTPDDNARKMIRKIFMNCPRWTPARQNDLNVSIRCSYIINFRN